MKFFVHCHFIIGGLFLILFLLTGGYMILNFPELYAGREEVRMMYRSTHVYILMSALINVMLGNALLHAQQQEFGNVRKVASLLILLTPLLFAIAFVVEPPRYLIERPISFWAVFFLFVGVLLHTAGNLKKIINWN